MVIGAFHPNDVDYLGILTDLHFDSHLRALARTAAYRPYYYSSAGSYYILREHYSYNLLPSDLVGHTYSNSSFRCNPPYLDSS